MFEGNSWWCFFYMTATESWHLRLCAHHGQLVVLVKLKTFIDLQEVARKWLGSIFCIVWNHNTNLNIKSIPFNSIVKWSDNQNGCGSHPQHIQRFYVLHIFNMLTSLFSIIWNINFNTNVLESKQNRTPQYFTGELKNKPPKLNWIAVSPPNPHPQREIIIEPFFCKSMTWIQFWNAFH